MNDINRIDLDKYDYLQFEPITFKDGEGQTVTFYKVPVYDSNGDLITVISGTFEILDNLIDLYTRAAMYDEQPKDLCLKIAYTIEDFLNDITE